MTRVLVIGGGGEGDFVCRRIAEALAASDRATQVAAPRDFVPASLDGVSAVVVCVTGSLHDISAGAAALAAAASMSIPPRIVYISSQSVYGEAAGEVDESAAPVGALSAYGAAKVAAEQALAAVSAVILRPGIIYGPGSAQWSGRIADWLIHRRLGDLGRNGDGCCNLVYIDDVVDAVLRVLQEPQLQGRVFNLSLPEPPAWNDYFIQYAKALGAVPVSRITRRRLAIETKLLAPPLKVLQIASQKLAPRLSHRLPEPIPPSALELFRQEIRLSVRAAETHLGMRWTDPATGLAAAARSYARRERTI